MSQPTPGPWVADRLTVRADCGIIAVCPEPTFYSGQADRYVNEMAERRANARLTAAAPDLLTALRGALTAWGAAKNGDIAAANWMNEAERVMLAALARAEGR